LDPSHVLMLNWRDTRNPEGGGSEVYVERIAAELASRGHQVTILCAQHGDAPAEERTGDGVTLLRRGGRRSVYPRAALTYLAGFFGFGRLSRRGLGRPALIIDVGNGMPFLSRFYARVPVVVLVHHVHREQWPVVMGKWAARFGWWVESRLAIWLYRDCRYVTVSGASRDELASLGVQPERITVVHNGTPELPGYTGAKDPSPSLVALGRLVPHKRVEIALRTVAKLVPELPELSLTVAGMGWWEADLRQNAIDLGIADRVRFAGFVTDEEKRDLLGRAWVALTPSLKEGWGLTIVEAAALGTPTVAFGSAGGVAEALADGQTGYLADDEEHFISLTHELLTNHVSRETMGEAARAHAASFTWQASGECFALLLSSVLSAAAAGRERTARGLPRRRLPHLEP
jgi:glycosyltransferase involved in cell wall biosynthesis